MNSKWLNRLLRFVFQLWKLEMNQNDINLFALPACASAVDIWLIFKCKTVEKEQSFHARVDLSAVPRPWSVWLHPTFREFLASLNESPPLYLCLSLRPSDSPSNVWQTLGQCQCKIGIPTICDGGLGGTDGEEKLGGGARRLSRQCAHVVVLIWCESRNSK